MIGSSWHKNRTLLSKFRVIVAFDPGVGIMYRLEGVVKVFHIVKVETLFPNL